ncbi:MAG: putative toxin-antitoxin system toxin component, PIN family [Limisphaerales bacterium]
MIVCIDTNTVVQALAQQHSFHPILDAWVAGRLTWAVSTPILLEYEEVLTRLSGPLRWRKLARLMDLAELTSENLLRVTPSFQFHVIAADPDDNIFTDCAITAEANYLLTEDTHFALLVDAGYKPRPITPQEFMVQFMASGTTEGR